MAQRAAAKAEAERAAANAKAAAESVQLHCLSLFHAQLTRLVSLSAGMGHGVSVTLQTCSVCTISAIIDTSPFPHHRQHCHRHLLRMSHNFLCACLVRGAIEKPLPAVLAPANNEIESSNYDYDLNVSYVTDKN